MQDRKKGFFGHRGRLTAFLICLVAVLGAVCIRQGILPVSYHLLDHPKVQDNRSVKKDTKRFWCTDTADLSGRSDFGFFYVKLYIKGKRKLWDHTGETNAWWIFPKRNEKQSRCIGKPRCNTRNLWLWKADQRAKADLWYDISFTKQNLEAADFLEYTECLGPTTGIQTQLPVYFAEYSLRSKNDVDTYLELLNLVPAYFKEILSFEQMKAKKGIFMSETTAQAIIDQCNDFLSKTEQNYLITIFAG